MRSLSMFLASTALVVGVAPAAVAGDGQGTRAPAAGQAVASPTSQVGPADSAVPGVQVDGSKTKISFDPDLGAPCRFDLTHALTDEYASLGVHFRGPADGEGGAILSECAKFGLRARSGSDFLAFSGGTYAVVPETISFDSPVSRVAFYVANGSRNESTYHLLALRDGQVVTRTLVVTKSAGYVGISVRANRGIDAVILKASTPDEGFVVDDLTFNTVG